MHRHVATFQPNKEFKTDISSSMVLFPLREVLAHMKYNSSICKFNFEVKPKTKLDFNNLQILRIIQYRFSSILLTISSRFILRQHSSFSNVFTESLKSAINENKKCKTAQSGTAKIKSPNNELFNENYSYLN